MSSRVGYALTVAGGLLFGAAHGQTMFAGIALAIAGLFALNDLDKEAQKNERKDVD